MREESPLYSTALKPGGDAASPREGLAAFDNPASSAANGCERGLMERRWLLSRLAGMSLFGAGAAQAQPAAKPKLKIMMRGGWGTDDPTRAAFVFAHALALADAGHAVQIFLTGEATYLMHKATVEAVKPIGWPPLTELREKIVAKGVPVFS